MKWRNWIVILVTGLAMALGSSSLSIAADREGLMEMLRDIEIDMAAISEHTAKLDQWVEEPNTYYTMTAYEYEWSGIEARFNDVGPLVPKLEAAAEGKPEWQKEAITELTGLIGAMEVQVDKALEHVGAVDNVERLFSRENYELRVESIMHYAAHIDEVIEHIQNKQSKTTPTS